MQSNILKGLERLFLEFSKINKLAKNIIKYGSQVSLALLLLGTMLVIFNHNVNNYDFYLELIATTIIRSSFTILAEVIIGGLLIDFIFKKA